MSSTSKQAIVEREVINLYKRVQHDIGSVRSGLSDAAHLLDAIAEDIVYENCPVRRKPRKDIAQVVRCFKRAADAIWALRDKVPQSTVQD